MTFAVIVGILVVIVMIYRMWTLHAENGKLEKQLVLVLSALTAFEDSIKHLRGDLDNIVRVQSRQGDTLNDPEAVQQAIQELKAMIEAEG